MVADSRRSREAEGDQPFARPPADMPLVIFADPGLDDARTGLLELVKATYAALPLALPETFAAISLGPCIVPVSCARRGEPILQLGGLLNEEPNLGDGEFNFELDTGAAFDFLSRPSVAVLPLDVTSVLKIDRPRLRSLEAAEPVRGDLQSCREKDAGAGRRAGKRCCPCP